MLCFCYNVGDRDLLQRCQGCDQPDLREDAFGFRTPRAFSQSLVQVKGNYTGKDQGSRLMWYTSMWLHNGIMQFSGQRGYRKGGSFCFAVSAESALRIVKRRWLFQHEKPSLPIGS